MEPKEKDTPAGVGPGITGASGDLIDATGEGHGVGGTGHDNEADAAGMRPDERYTARPDEGRSGEGASSTRASGSTSGTVGGGGPNAVQASDGETGANGEAPGGARNVTPANDTAADSDRVHESDGQER